MQAIAIIGVGCRLPGADGPQELWKLLVEGREGIGEVPTERWDAAHYYDVDPLAAGKIGSRWGGFVAGLGEFDAEHFGISHEEAVRIDPQHKLMLEVSYQALENAGLPVKALAGSQTGVFVGVSHSDQDNKLKRDVLSIDANLGVHTYHCFAANRVSYHFNFQGPSMAVDTACSSSLLAIHLACQSLLSGECDLALAGGVNAHLMPEESVSSTKMGLLSRDGRCRSFALDAQGHARSEGAGVLVLRRLDDALARGEEIWAVIRGTATNHNGASNGITAPNGPAQERVIRSALRRAQIDARELGYIEAHATATPLGDQVEWGVLHDVLAGDSSRQGPCYVGSIKSNLGHLEAAAGVAGLIKCVLALQNELIPRSLHAHQPNPKLRADPLLQLASENIAWPRRDHTRRLAGVSAFAFGGSNCHVVLEEGPARAARAEDALPHVLVLSARSETALQRLREQIAAPLREDAASLGELCYSLATGRTALPLRCALVAQSRTELRERLLMPEHSDGAPLQGRAARVAPRVVLRAGSGRVGSPTQVAALRARWPDLSADVSVSLSMALRLCLAEERDRLSDLCFTAALLQRCAVRAVAYVAADSVAAMAAWWLYQRQAASTLSETPWRAPGTYDLQTGAFSSFEAKCSAITAKPTRYLRLDGDEAGLPGASLDGSGRDGHGRWLACDASQLLSTLARLWVDGVSVDWSGLYAGRPYRRVLVPNYPFEKKRSWFVLGEPKESTQC